MADQILTRETISVVTTNVTATDKALGGEFNRVAWIAMGCAEMYLKHGPDEARLQITKAFLSSLSRLSAIDSKTQIDESREALFAVINDQMAIPESRPVVTADSILDAISHDPLPQALDRSAHHQNDDD